MADLACSDDCSQGVFKGSCQCFILLVVLVIGFYGLLLGLLIVVVLLEFEGRAWESALSLLNWEFKVHLWGFLNFVLIGLVHQELVVIFRNSDVLHFRACYL